MDTMGLHLDDLSGFVLLRVSTLADASIVLGHALKLALGPEMDLDVLIITCLRSTLYYTTLFRRLGLNVASLASSGRVTILDALPTGAGIRGADLVDLRQLMQRIVEVSCGSETGRRVLLVLDNLTVGIACADVEILT